MLGTSVIELRKTQRTGKFRYNFEKARKEFHLPFSQHKRTEARVD